MATQVELEQAFILSLFFYYFLIVFFNICDFCVVFFGVTINFKFRKIQYDWEVRNSESISLLYNTNQSIKQYD